MIFSPWQRYADKLDHAQPAADPTAKMRAWVDRRQGAINLHPEKPLVVKWYGDDTGLPCLLDVLARHLNPASRTPAAPLDGRSKLPVLLDVRTVSRNALYDVSETVARVYNYLRRELVEQQLADGALVLVYRLSANRSDATDLLGPEGHLEGLKNDYPAVRLIFVSTWWGWWRWRQRVKAFYPEVQVEEIAIGNRWLLLSLPIRRNFGKLTRPIVSVISIMARWLRCWLGPHWKKILAAPALLAAAILVVSDRPLLALGSTSTSSLSQSQSPVPLAVTITCAGRPPYTVRADETITLWEGNSVVLDLSIPPLHESSARGWLSAPRADPRQYFYAPRQPGFDIVVFNFDEATTGGISARSVAIEVVSERRGLCYP